MPDRYQGFTLDAHPHRDPSRRATGCVVWARDAQDEPIFGIDVVTTDRYARAHLSADSASDSQATDLALGWAHGLIDTETWESNTDATEVLRTSDWDPSRNDSGRTDDSLMEQLLHAFARMDRISAIVDYAPRLDVAGLADVVGVPSTRIQGLLAVMATRGWIEPYGYERRPRDGNARITKDGYARLDAIRMISGRGLSPMMQDVEGYLRAKDFIEHFPKAWSSWDHATKLLSEKPLRAGIIGYACREAMQAFAGELVAMHAIGIPPPPDQVTNRIRAVVRKDSVGEKTADFVDALVNYWSKTFDLTQRQAKNAVREGENLTEDDARRVIMYTALVMYEVPQVPPESGR